MSPAGLESKGKLRGKAKAQKKKEEREKKTSVKTPGDDLKDNLADNDDSSSTTTETSNPDVEANIKEVPVIPHGASLKTGTFLRLHLIELEVVTATAASRYSEHQDPVVVLIRSNDISNV